MKCTATKIIQEEKNGIVCVTVKGRMEAGLAPVFEKKIQDIIAGNRTRRLFDLSALDYLRSSVLRVILNAVKEIKHKSGRVVLCCMRGYLKEIRIVSVGAASSPDQLSNDWRRIAAGSRSHNLKFIE